MNDRSRWQNSPKLKRRRAIAVLCAAGLVDAALMALKQFGAVKKLPDLPLKGFDSDAVVSSKAAYVLGTPDSSLGALSYAVTLALNGWLRPSRTWKFLFGASVLGGAIGAAGYGWDMISREKKACAYCIPALLINLSLVPLAMSELVHSSK